MLGQSPIQFPNADRGLAAKFPKDGTGKLIDRTGNFFEKTGKWTRAETLRSCALISG
jgi:hypothetical protein